MECGNVSTAKEKLTSLANAFRSQTGRTDVLSLDDMIGIASTPNFLVDCINNKRRPSDGAMIITAEDLYGITKIPERMFEGTNFFNEITFPDTLTSISFAAFRDCVGLKRVSIPPSVTTFGSTPFINSSIEILDLNCDVAGDVFYGCTNLKSVYVGIESSLVGGAAFMNCSSLTAMVVYGDRICTLESPTLVGTPIASGSGYIYVPSALIDEYKSTAHWSTYVNQIRAIEDYPDITGG